MQSNDALDQDQQGYSGDDNNSPSLRVGDGGPKVYDGLFFDVIGKILLDTEIAKVYDKVRKLSFDKFIEWTNINFDRSIFGPSEVEGIRSTGAIEGYTESELKDVLNNYRKMRAFGLLIKVLIR